jgi:hypothetical protein
VLGGSDRAGAINPRFSLAIAIGLELEIRFFGKAIDSFRKKIDTTSEKIGNDFG